ncbi:MAG TPA: Na+/H+ antiporter NhaA [Gammaproteobacteria bacterium]|nr:Na+/H+ antiporter NhaA [Gammaproteobacteria bacterium]
MVRHDAPEESSSRARIVAERVLGTLERFLRVEAASGIVLMISAAAALVWANSPFADSYEHFWHTPVTVGLGGRALSTPLHFWVNDGLMTVFFLVVGMEIRRELHEGALATARAAALPVIAALGGVLVPAVLYLAVNGGDPAARNGWAVPTATDIAFAVGVLALLGKSIPAAVRIFLLAIAIIDDIAAVIIIAAFHSSGLEPWGVAIAGLGVLGVLGMQRLGIASAPAYVLPGIVVWWGVLVTGVHPTLAGVLLGLMTPMVYRGLPPPAVRVETALHPWVAFGVMPLFALANAGVRLDGLDFGSAGAAAVLSGTVAGLVLGKPVGIVLATLAAVRSGVCRLPAGVTWRGVLLVGWLGGIGFTMSIFIATLAFGEGHLLSAAKGGVLMASVIAGLIGLAYGRAVLSDRR